MTKEEMLEQYNLRVDYRNIFFSEAGKRVLEHLMKENAVLRDDMKASNPELIGRSNAVKGILNMLCSLDDKEQSLTALIEGLAKVPVLAHNNIGNIQEE